MNDFSSVMKETGSFCVKILLLFFGLMIGLVILELLTTMAVDLKILPPYKTMSASGVHDDVLGYALPPHSYADVDKNGFRNRSVPENVEIVALGDSQTYGYNALSDESWPKQLGSRTGHSVYNMGMGGYGPAQYYYLADKALSMHPRLVVVGFYLGNDISDACQIFALDYWKNFAKEKGLNIDDCLNNLDGSLAPNSLVPPRSFWERMRDSVRDSNFLMLLKQIPAVSNFVSHERDLKSARKNPDDYLVVDNGEVNTIFSLGKPGGKIGLDLPNIRKGMELTKFFFGELDKKIKADKSKLLIVFIPDKPDVFYDYFISTGYSVPDNYRRNVLYHKEIENVFTEYFKNLNVPTVDAGPFMKGRILDQNPPLFNNYLDSHPTRVGYEEMAKAAASQVNKLLQ